MSAPTFPLVVDFDGTLSLADTLAWLRHRCLKLSPGVEAERKVRLARSKQAEKVFLWDEIGLDLDDVPFDDGVIDWLRSCRGQGRDLVLVTGSAQGLADAVSARLGLFTDARGSDLTVNLTGPRKAAALVEAYGEGGYDYLGDSEADLPVWEGARRGWCVIRPSTPPLVLPSNVETLPSDRPLIDPSGHSYDHEVASVDLV